MAAQADRWSFRPWVEGEELRASLRGLLASEQRAASVLAGSMIDSMLTKLIAARAAASPDAAGAGAVEGLDYSAKCTSIREMGLIGEKMLAELRTLGRIRNEFAHNPSPDLGFDSPEIASAVERLRSPLQVALDRKVPGAGPGVQDALERSMPLAVNGRRYWWTVSVLSALAVLGARLHAAGTRGGTDG